ncbi:hypothetical protein FA13DRAFT_1179104 [Coprinellus micaceus]|uniref:Secreted protein n=1 Tax=Coprinellus micaceus TaxID=71717 RepID=A0A4Y7SU51_COPMI|nr:hypothetical protein FA13DRAFT_1179104 [Coprinellus micaceus]
MGVWCSWLCFSSPLLLHRVPPTNLSLPQASAQSTGHYVDAQPPEAFRSRNEDWGKRLTLALGNFSLVFQRNGPHLLPSSPPLSPSSSTNWALKVLSRQFPFAMGPAYCGFGSPCNAVLGPALT